MGAQLTMDPWGRDQKAPVVPQNGMHLGVLTAGPSFLLKKAPGTQKQNPQLCAAPGREARRCLLFVCKGSCQK